MANDPSAALASEPDAPSEEDFQAFLVALSGSARGRAFLAEHARRCRSEDSEMLLSAVQRLEGLVLSQAPPPPAADNPIDELRGMLEAIRDVQAELDVSTLAAQVANLAGLIENVQQRIETLVVPPAAALVEEAAVADAAAPEPVDMLAAEPAAMEELATPEPFDAEAALKPVDAALAEPAMPAEVEAATEAETEAFVEAPLEPATELAALAMPEPAEPAVAEAMPEDAWPAIPEVAWCDSDTAAVEAAAETSVEDVPVEQASAAQALPDEATAPEAAVDEAPVEHASADALAVDEAPAAKAGDIMPPPGLAIAALVETLVVPSAGDTAATPEAKVIKAGTIPPPAPFAGEDFTSLARPRTMPPEVDPLADIKALSDDERVALFT